MEPSIPTVLVTLLITVYSKESYSALLTSKIIGGEIVTNNDYNFLAYLRYRGVQKCGGALISSSHVLTAGNCVYGLKVNTMWDITVTVGSTYARSGGESHTIRKVAYPPGFENRYPSRTADLAVLHLGNHVSYPAQFPSVATVSPMIVRTGILAYISGWGYYQNRMISAHLNLKSDLLKVLAVRTISNYQCSLTLRHGVDAIHPSQMCAVAAWREGENFSMGDEGGPLVVGRYIIGVASISHQNPHIPGVYTRVSDYYHFIMDELNPKGQQDVLNDAASYEDWSGTESDTRNCTTLSEGGSPNNNEMNKSLKIHHSRSHSI